MNKEQLGQIEQIIGYEFSNRELLKQAFNHSSAVEERASSNERLEFLGDAVLGGIICEKLYRRFNYYLEGDLTKIKSMLVSRRTCARVAKNLGLHSYLNVGKGMSESRALSGSLAAAVLEAVIAAVYLDGGLEAARRFVLDKFGAMIDEADARQIHGNYKSVLQQYAQQHLNLTPVYELLDEKGPDHDKCFESEAVVGGRHFPSAWGINKKEAEQKAAFNALVELDVIRKSPGKQE